MIVVLYLAVVHGRDVPGTQSGRTRWWAEPSTCRSTGSSCSPSCSAKAIAGLTGTIRAFLLAGVFPTSYNVPILITIYATPVSGGSGSLAGAVVGAIAVNVSLEVLRDANHARWPFYSVISITLLAKVRPWRKLAVVLTSLVAFGTSSTCSSRRRGPPVRKDAGRRRHRRPGRSELGHRSCRARPDRQLRVGLVIALMLPLTVGEDPWRTILLCRPSTSEHLWENLLMATVEAQAATRHLVGALSVVLMAVRPHGRSTASCRGRVAGERAPVLELVKVSKSFGGLVVVDALDLVVGERRSSA